MIPGAVTLVAIVETLQLHFNLSKRAGLPFREMCRQIVEGIEQVCTNTMLPRPRCKTVNTALRI